VSGGQGAWCAVRGVVGVVCVGGMQARLQVRVCKGAQVAAGRRQWRAVGRGRQVVVAVAPN